MAASKETYILKWKIENFSFCAHGNGERLTSPEFSTDLLGGSKWQLGIYPRGVDDKSKTNVSCFLKKCSIDVESVQLKFNINVIKEDGSCNNPPCMADFIFKDLVGNGCVKLIEREELSSNPAMYLPHDILSVRCTLLVVGFPPAQKTHESRIQETFFPHIDDEVDLKKMEILALNRDLIQKTQCVPEEWEARTVIEVQQMSVEFFGVISERYIPIVITDSYFPSLMVLMKLETDEEKTVQIKIRELNKQTSAFAKCNLCFLDSNEVTLHEGEYEHFFSRSSPEEWTINVKLNKVNEGFFSNPVKVKFNFRKSVNSNERTWIETVKYKNWHPFSPESASSNFREDMLNMYTKQAFCDFTFVTGEAEEVHVHKVVLGMRSPVFKAMLERNRKEARENRVVVRDIDAKTLDLFFRYMYSAILPNVVYADAQKLYCAAEKYQMIELKDHCSKVIQSGLNLSTAYDILCFSDLHKDKALKNAVVEFVYRHSSEVFISDTWISLIDTHPQLVSEVLRWASVKSS